MLKERVYGSEELEFIAHSESDKILDKLVDLLRETDIHQIESLHEDLLRKLPSGWLVIVMNKENNYVLTDLVSSIRVLYDSHKWWIETPFCGEAIQGFTKNKDYKSGVNTVWHGVKRVLPCSVLVTPSMKQKFTWAFEGRTTFQTFKNSVASYYVKYYQGSLPVIAFSGGTDSVFVTRILMANIPNLELRFLELPKTGEGPQSIEKARKKAKELGLRLVVDRLEEKEIDQWCESYPNDATEGFLGLNLWLRKLNSREKLVITGQNSDTFIGFGLTRRYHPMETMIRYFYAVLYRRIYYEKRIFYYQKVLMRMVYRYYGLSRENIPMNKKEFLMGLETEYNYLSVYEKEETIDIEYYDKNDYLKDLFINKFINHIAGNHSYTWTAGVSTFMPFSTFEFIDYCFRERINSMGTRFLFDPKKDLR